MQPLSTHVHYQTPNADSGPLLKDEHEGVGIYTKLICVQFTAPFFMKNVSWAMTLVQISNAGISLRIGIHKAPTKKSGVHATARVHPPMSMASSPPLLCQNETLNFSAYVTLAPIPRKRKDPHLVSADAHVYKQRRLRDDDGK